MRYPVTVSVMKKALSATAVVAFVLLSNRTRASAVHVRFAVAEMRNADPSDDGTGTTSVSGACVPSHDRQTLACYFTAVHLWKTEHGSRKQLDDIAQEMRKNQASR